MDAAEFERWYGPWVQPSPADVAHILAGLSCDWWIAGGWTIEAFTGQTRPHEDTDVAILREDLPIILEYLLPNYCVWSNLNGALRPLQTVDDLVPACRQLWVRADSSSPWLMDLLLTPHQADTWISVRDEQIQRPLTASLFTDAAGIRYLRPEMVLHLKARLNRPKDNDDLKAVLPLLDLGAKSWLRAALEIANPDHPWLEVV